MSNPDGRDDMVTAIRRLGPKEVRTQCLGWTIEAQAILSTYERQQSGAEPIEPWQDSPVSEAMAKLAARLIALEEVVRVSAFRLDLAEGKVSPAPHLDDEKISKILDLSTGRLEFDMKGLFGPPEAAPVIPALVGHTEGLSEESLAGNADAREALVGLANLRAQALGDIFRQRLAAELGKNSEDVTQLMAATAMNLTSAQFVVLLGSEETVSLSMLRRLSARGSALLRERRTPEFQAVVERYRQTYQLYRRTSRPGP